MAKNLPYGHLPTIGAAVRRWKKARGMTTEELAAATTSQGFAISYQVIANIEAGRRAYVTTDELTALGAALQVPPALLLYDLRSQAEIEMLPGNHATPWMAYRWFIGDVPRSVPSDGAEGRWVDLDDVDYEQWRNAQRPLLLLRQHASLVEDFALARANLDAEDAADRQELARQRVRNAALRLVWHRSTMQEDDVEPPDLPPELAVVIASVGNEK